jgi:ligand-binding sensor domain-containing protein
MNADSGSRMSAIVVFAVLAVGVLSASQPPGAPARFGVDLWGESEGLPQSRIRAITQTRDGYLWFGSGSGLVRFNGASFKTFDVGAGGLRDDEVLALAEDERGLWIGTHSGGASVLKAGRFRTYSSADGLADDIVTGFDQDAQGNLWIATPRGVNLRSDRLSAPFRLDKGSESLVPGLCARCLGAVMVSTNSHVYRLTGERFEAVAGIVEPADGDVERILGTRDGALWIGFSGSLVKRWKDGRLSVYRWKGARPRQVTALYEDPRGRVWAAVGGTLYWWRGERFEAVPLEDSGIDLGIIHSIYVDRENNVWLGRQSSGVARLQVKQLSTVTVQDGLPNSNTRTVFEDSRGTVWIGVVAGFARYRDGTATPYTQFEGRGLRTVRAFAEDRAGHVWIAAGPELLEWSHNRLVRVRGWSGSATIRVLYRDPGGAMWVGTDGDGVFRQSGGAFEHFRARDGLGGNAIRAIATDGDGNTWISVLGQGVVRYAGGCFHGWSTADGLASDRVAAIHAEPDGTLWFATRRGLSRFKNGRFFTYPAKSGLTAGFLYSILDDGRGGFWFGSAAGLLRVSRSELNEYADGKLQRLTMVGYGTADGMKTRACNVGNQPVAWRTAAGLLLFSSLDGAVVVDAARLSPNRFIPPVRIEQVTLNGREQVLEGPVKAPVGAGEVEIHYAALTYLTPGKVRFKYKLEGIDDDWVEAGSRRFAHYANLRSGEYRFRVIAGNLDGAWNQTGATYGFFLKPHFYETRPFLAALVAALALISWMSFRLHLHGVKARYSAVLAERNRISQDLHDTLTQNLAGIALRLDSIHMQLDDLPEDLRRRLALACALTRYSLAEARRAICDLRSDDLDRRELAEAVPEIVDRLASGTAIQTHTCRTSRRAAAGCFRRSPSPPCRASPPTRWYTATAPARRTPPNTLAAASRRWSRACPPPTVPPT